MNNEKKLRLIQVAKEFKVGLNTITDFLHKKGVNIDVSPNAQITADVYEILEKEFGANRPRGNERESVREKISQKQATISIDEAPKQAKEEREVSVKSNVIDIRSEITQPKILGKIDIDRNGMPKAVKEQPKPEPAPEPVRPAEEVAAKAEPEKVVEPAPKPEPAPEPAPAAVQESRPEPETPKAEAPKAAAPAGDGIFRPSDTPTLSGPQILGKMDVSGMVPGGKHKRKRLDKEKVDVTRQNNHGAQNGKPGQQAPKRDNGAFGGGKQNGANNQKKKNQHQKSQPKPIIRPEVSDEEVSKQIKDTLARLTAKGAKNKGAKYRKEKREEVRERMHEEIEREVQERKILKVTEFVTVSELATMMNVSPMEVISACMNLGLMVSINQRLDAEALVVVAEEFGFKTEFVSVEIQEAIDTEDNDSEEDLVPRPPIVTVMGHVDHGKTSLLDNIRKTNVIEGEAGGITQHIGAYSVELNGQKITFLDTPGHEAFTAMRARGAKITDVAIIIVAADDNVMPQTVEAINHAQAAGVPMVFAINKIDKPNANPEHIKEQLANMNYLVEDWGGKYQSQDISAKKGLNLDKLLEKVLLEAEMLELKANPNKRAKGAVIESTLDKGRGYVATVLVQNGTLHVGDVVLSGIYTGRVKAMFDENGKKVESAGPSTPVQLLGLNGAPQAGDSFNVMEDDRSAREIANKREQLQRMQGIMTQKHVTLDEIGRRIAIGSFKELNIIVKGLEGDGAGERHTCRRRTDFGVGRTARRRIERHHRRIPGAPVGRSPQARREGGDRDTPLLDHLRRHQRYQGCNRGYARACDEGGDRMLDRGDGDIQDIQGRHRRRMYRPRGQAAAQHPDTRNPRRNRDPHRKARLAQAFQGRRQGGGFGTGLRSEHRVLQRHPRGRHRRGIRAGRGKTQMTEQRTNPIIELLCLKRSNSPLRKRPSK